MHSNSKVKESPYTTKGTVMDDLTGTITNAQEVQNLPEPERKAIAEVALSNLGPGAQQDVMQQARVPMPGQQTADRIWSIIVTGFIVVLIGAFLSLALVHTGTMNFLYNATISGDVLLTVFTTAAGFLAGLLSPSPLRGGSSSNG
jgi:hypothetical protein